MQSTTKLFRIGTMTLIVVLGVTPFVSFAQSTADLQARIQSLLREIESLQQRLAQIEGGGQAAWCHTFNTNLGIGSTGEEVEHLTTALQKEGFSIKNSKFYDETLASFVSAFQEKYRGEILEPAGLAAGTGYVGPKTRTKLNVLYGCGTGYSSTTEKSRQSSSIVKDKSLISPQIKPPQTPVPERASMVVVSPNGGEIGESWVKGQSYDIRWKSSGLTTVSGINLIDYTPGSRFGLQYGIASMVDAMTGFYSWKIPEHIPEGKYYYVAVGTGGATDLSDGPFSIVSGEGWVGGSDADSGAAVVEQVKCVFKGSGTTESCTTANGSASFSCTGIETCIVTVSGAKGEAFTWKSTCGGYAYTTIDGENKYANFDCGSPQTQTQTTQTTQITSTTTQTTTGGSVQQTTGQQTTGGLAPYLSGLYPATITQNTTGNSITIYGAHLSSPTVTVCWEGPHTGCKIGYLVIPGIVTFFADSSITNTPGTYSVSVKNIDGQVSGTVTLTVLSQSGMSSTAGVNSAPVVHVLYGLGLEKNADTGKVFAGQNVTYTVNGYDSDSGDYVQRVTFNWGDGSMPTILGPKNYNKIDVTAPYTWSSPGIYKLTVTLEDTHGVTVRRTASITVASF